MIMMLFGALGTVHLKSGGPDDLGEGHKISNIVLGGLKFIMPVLGSYKFSYIKLLGFNCLDKYSALQNRLHVPF